MLFFRNDYGNGAHPAVMDALCKTNLELTVGYGTDAYCQKAAQRICQLCNAPEAEVHFIVGGTQVNKTAIGAFLGGGDHGGYGPYSGPRSRCGGE